MGACPSHKQKKQIQSFIIYRESIRNDDNCPHQPELNLGQQENRENKELSKKDIIYQIEQAEQKEDLQKLNSEMMNEKQPETKEQSNIKGRSNIEEYKQKESQRQSQIKNSSILNTLSYNCIQCNNPITLQQIQLLDCNHAYHLNCLANLFRNQISNKMKHLIKCKCGYKLSSSKIRELDIYDKDILLSRYFQTQILLLLEQNKRFLKYVVNIKEQQDLIEEYKQFNDYFYIKQSRVLLQTDSITPQGD